jgi:nucleotide-binding universal stress UspA family protein
MQNPFVAAATDGTEAGTPVVQWAAKEAERRRLPLRVVHVLDGDWSVERYDYQGDNLDTARRLANMVAEDAAQKAGAVAPAVDVGFQVLVGHPVSCLQGLSETATLMVLGNRGRGGFAGLTLGSVSQRIAMHAHCPVAVVRGRTDAAEGPVAVGVDDSPAADAVLAAAFSAAAERHTGLVAVRSYSPGPATPLGRIPVAEIETPEQDAVERQRVNAQLAPWHTKHPDVPVEIVVSRDSPAAMLVEMSHGAQLAVVGSRGHGLLTGTLLGSTSLQLLHHSHCPVLVVRAGRTPER